MPVAEDPRIVRERSANQLHLVGESCKVAFQRRTRSDRAWGQGRRHSRPDRLDHGIDPRLAIGPIWKPVLDIRARIEFDTGSSPRSPYDAAAGDGRGAFNLNFRANARNGGAFEQHAGARNVADLDWSNARSRPKRGEHEQVRSRLDALFHRSLGTTRHGFAPLRTPVEPIPPWLTTRDRKPGNSPRFCN